MHYSYPQEVLQEVPGELSLSLSMSGCNIYCKCCHSKETWDPNFGKELTINELDRLLKRHKHISCVLFYGGEWNMEELEGYVDYVKNKNLKVGLYTGRELNYFSDDFIQKLNYIKVNPYIEELGGLNSELTNQRLLKISAGKITEIKILNSIYNT